VLQVAVEVEVEGSYPGSGLGMSIFPYPSETLGGEPLSRSQHSLNKVFVKLASTCFFQKQVPVNLETYVVVTNHKITDTTE